MEDFKNQQEDKNLTVINSFINESHVKQDDYGGIHNIIQSIRIEKKYYSIKKENKEHLKEKKIIDIKNFLGHFEIVMSAVELTATDILRLIDEYINNNSLVQFIYNHLIVKLTEHKNLATKIESSLLDNTTSLMSTSIDSSRQNETIKSSGEPIANIANNFNQVYPLLVNIENSVSSTRDEQVLHLTNLAHDLANSNNSFNEFKSIALEKIEGINSVVGVIIPSINEIGSHLNEVFPKLVEISRLVSVDKSVLNESLIKINRSYIKDIVNLTPFIFSILSFCLITIMFLFFIYPYKIKSQKEYEGSFSNSNGNLKNEIIASLNPLSKSIGDLNDNFKRQPSPLLKNFDDNEILKIKNEFSVVLNELFNNKKLIIDTAKFDTLIKTLVDFNSVLPPKEEVKGKGEEKKGKDIQPKGIQPSHKVTLEDKKDIAKITSDAIKSIIEQEIVKISSNNDKSKNKGDELVVKEKLITELRISQEILKNDLESQKNLVISKEKELLDITKSKKGFKGPPGSYAILLTNSKDFELNEPILSATLDIVEKQNKESNGVQKLGIYAATGNSIDTKFNLKKRARGLKPTEMDVANARPTETIAEVGKTFLEYAFDDGKEPIIPVNERKAIIIATWAAGAPKNNDGWDNISQVDAILIQTPKANQLREGSAWLDFILKKNGRLLFVQAEEKINGGSPAIDQLQRHLSTLLNTKKE